jgi:hypothetical protein
MLPGLAPCSAGLHVKDVAWAAAPGLPPVSSGPLLTLPPLPPPLCSGLRSWTLSGGVLSRPTPPSTSWRASLPACRTRWPASRWVAGAEQGAVWGGVLCCGVVDGRAGLQHLSMCQGLGGLCQGTPNKPCTAPCTYGTLSPHHATIDHDLQHQQHPPHRLLSACSSHLPPPPLCRSRLTVPGWSCSWSALRRLPRPRPTAGRRPVMWCPRWRRTW